MYAVFDSVCFWCRRRSSRILATLACAAGHGRGLAGASSHLSYSCSPLLCETARKFSALPADRPNEQGGRENKGCTSAGTQP